MITRAHVVALSWGIAGMLLAVLLLHFFFDHLTFHSLVAALQQQQQRQATQPQVK